MKRQAAIAALQLLACLALLGCNIKSAIETETYLTSKEIATTKLATLGGADIVTKGATDYTATPTAFSGRLLFLHFHSDSAIDPSNNYFPADCWGLRDPEGKTEDECYINGGTVFFDLSQLHEVSGGQAGFPDRAGFGIYRSVFLGYTYVDVSFLVSGQEYSVRVCTSDRDGCTRGDLMIKDIDGVFKWISESGDPDMLLPERPADPVCDEDIASHASGWASGDPTASIFITEAAIPDEWLFDVSSTSATYRVVLDFELENTILLTDIDPLYSTKRDILKKLVLNNFVGKGGNKHLTVRPQVELVGE